MTVLLRKQECTGPWPTWCPFTQQIVGERGRYDCQRSLWIPPSTGPVSREVVELLITKAKSDAFFQIYDRHQFIILQFCQIISRRVEDEYLNLQLLDLARKSPECLPESSLAEIAEERKQLVLSKKTMVTKLLTNPAVRRQLTEWTPWREPELQNSNNPDADSFEKYRTSWCALFRRWSDFLILGKIDNLSSSCLVMIEKAKHTVAGQHLIRIQQRDRQIWDNQLWRLLPPPL